MVNAYMVTYYVWIFILNNSAIWLVNTKPQNIAKFNPEECFNTMKISSRYHRLLIYDVKRTTKIFRQYG